MKTIPTRRLITLLLILSCRSLLAESFSGYVITWGANLSPKDTNLPPVDYYYTGAVTIAGSLLSNAVAISAGGSHALAITSQGAVVGWGGNISGAAVGYESPYPHLANGYVKIRGEVIRNAIAISAGRRIAQSFSLALNRDNTVTAWGDNRFGQTSVPLGLTNVTAIAAGAYQALALKKEGTIVSWGEGSPPPRGLSNVVAIAAGGEYGHNLALKSDGTVVEWGVRSAANVATVPSRLRNVVAVAAGLNHSLALNRDGTVIGWGNNWLGGATGVPTTEFPHQTTGSVMIAGQVLSNVVSIAAGNEYSLALRKDGTVVTWGNPHTMQIRVPIGLSNVVAIAAGANYCLAIATNVLAR